MNLRDELFDLSLKSDKREGFIRDLLRDYDVRKKPEKHCYECLHYYRLGSGDFTYIRKPPHIGGCNLGHTPNRYAADFCKDFQSTRGDLNWLKE